MNAESVLAPFIKYTITVLKDMAQLPAEAGEIFEDDIEKFRFKGFAVGMPLDGTIKGVVLMHHYVETCELIGNRLLQYAIGQKESVSSDNPDLRDALKEFVNVINGHTTGYYKDNQMKLKLTPPFFISDTETMNKEIADMKQVFTAPIFVSGERFFFNLLLKDPIKA